jgi:hypothetical protein
MVLLSASDHPEYHGGPTEPEKDITVDTVPVDTVPEKGITDSTNR